MAGSFYDFIEVVGIVEIFDKEVVSREDVFVVFRYREEDVGEDGSIWVIFDVDGEGVEWGEMWWSCDTETEDVFDCF